MRTQGNGNLARSPGTESEQQEPVSEACVEFSVDTLPAELLTQLGAEYFVVGTFAEVLNVAEHPGGTRESVSADMTNRVANTNEHAERDFWGEVAALSNGGLFTPSHVLGGKPDVVAYAIATVAAKYAFATEPKPGVPVNQGVGTVAPRAAPAHSTGNSSSTAKVDDASRLDQCDLEAVLESLLDFEQAAGLTEIRELDLTSFEQARKRAASSVVAANVIQNSALKAAEGRRG